MIDEILPSYNDRFMHSEFKNATQLQISKMKKMQQMCPQIKTNVIVIKKTYIFVEIFYSYTVTRQFGEGNLHTFYIKITFTFTRVHNRDWKTTNASYCSLVQQD